ncbi:hypothetical protein OUZ56_014500 [Daphnia magna]|uniref:Uncharacterized protein n=1 Tax=Daphnia magna TaxID=35525 RepID=A0ABR0AJY5_9CRUS|nr:hypothetical protein OUZ56_014500 [Daphnia magna]
MVSIRAISKLPPRDCANTKTGNIAFKCVSSSSYYETEDHQKCAGTTEECHLFLTGACFVDMRTSEMMDD